MADTMTAEVDVVDVGYGGDGVARLGDGMTLFVPFAAVGDRLRVRVTERRQRFARGEIVEALRPGPARITPPCPWYGRCGGCRYQHVTHAEQVRLKSAQLTALLTRVGKLKDLPPTEGAAPSPRAFAYRNKITLRPVADRGWGYVDMDNETPVAVERCLLAHEDLNARFRELTTSGEIAQLRAEPPEAPLTLRRSSTGQLAAFRGTTPETLTEIVLGQGFQVAAAGFFQVNPFVLDGMAEWLRGAVAPDRLDILLDAYCGCGVFAALLGGRAAEVVGIESEAAAVRHAERNARAAGIARARFVQGEVEKRLHHELERIKPAMRSCVALDPPRAGCHERVIESLRRAPPGQVLYVSCNPAALARDLARLTADRRLRLTRLALFDMFPQTEHFETVAVLERAE
jgi:23S rRNA (uracil1939-C5)-methyltransferase